MYLLKKGTERLGLFNGVADIGKKSLLGRGVKDGEVGGDTFIFKRKVKSVISLRAFADEPEELATSGGGSARGPGGGKKEPQRKGEPNGTKRSGVPQR